MHTAPAHVSRPKVGGERANRGKTYGEQMMGWATEPVAGRGLAEGWQGWGASAGEECKRSTARVP